MIYLSFEGEQITKGATTDATTNTSAAAKQDATIPPYLSARPSDRKVIIRDTYFRLAELLGPYDVALATTRPASGPYQMIVFGGSSELIGFPAGIGAVSDPDCGDTVASDISFIFDTIDDEAWTTQVSMASIGLNVGIPSTNRWTDCMCFSGSECGYMHPAINCTLGTNVPVATGAACVPPYTGAIDDQTRFEDAFGCRQ